MLHNICCQMFSLKWVMITLYLLMIIIKKYCGAKGRYCFDILI